MKLNPLALSLCLLPAVAFFAQSQTEPKDHTLVTFQKTQLSPLFHAEGAGVGDFNRDGHKDVTIGGLWYAGPDFKTSFSFRPVQTFQPKLYSDAFSSYGYDFDGDGWDDILIIDIPGKPAAWYQNPQGKPGPWKRFEIHPWIGNESPLFIDVVGDSRPELVFNIEGYLGYAAADWEHPQKTWTFHKVSHAKGAFFVYTHGVGVGDINGDGRKDIVEALGWWEQPAPAASSLGKDEAPDHKEVPWKFHKFPFADGAAQILVTDVNGDGLNDIITAWHPHKYGIVWWEQLPQSSSLKEGNDPKNDEKGNSEINFTKHVLTGEKETDSPFGVKFTQAHAFASADIDGDGLLDFVTGKRWWAHEPPIDPESDAPAVLYWWKLVRTPEGGATFLPILIDEDSGVGTQFSIEDLNGDSSPDIVIANKKGNFIFLSKREKVTKTEWEKSCSQKKK